METLNVSLLVKKKMMMRNYFWKTVGRDRRSALFQSGPLIKLKMIIATTLFYHATNNENRTKF